MSKQADTYIEQWWHDLHVKHMNCLLWVCHFAYMWVGFVNECKVAKLETVVSYWTLTCSPPETCVYPFT